METFGDLKTTVIKFDPDTRTLGHVGALVPMKGAAKFRSVGMLGPTLHGVDCLRLTE
eukprot:SAG31_NODE_1462_length_8242_cov_5.541135_5_plen_57_part_00